MDRGVRTAFVALVAAQAAHSIEEYVFRLFDVFAPARFVSSLVSTDLARGFAIANIGLVLLASLSYVGIARNQPWAAGLAWFWGLLELGNGLGHAALAVVSGGYFPGVGTAPLLLASSAYLISRLSVAPPLDSRQV